MQAEIPPAAPVEASLKAAWERGREAWPGVQLDSREFCDFVAARLPEGGLGCLHTDDLFLTCACITGDDVAQRAFLDACLPVVRAAMSRIDPSGSLDEDMLLALVSADNQELTYFKQLYRDAFKTAFHQVLARLDGRQRNLLTLQLVEGLTLEQIGELYQVNRSTVSRWLQAVRDRLAEETRAALMESLEIGQEEFESILMLVLSRFDASLARVLSEDEEDPA